MLKRIRLAFIIFIPNTVKEGMTIMNRFLLCCSVLLASFSVPIEAPASSIVALSEADLCYKADAIVFGRLLETHNVFVPGGRAVTRASLQVYRSAHGAKIGDVLTVELPGGVSEGGLVQSVSGAPKLRAGQFWFAFLLKAGATYRPWGMAYGMLPVTRIGQDAYLVQRDNQGLGLFRDGEHIAEDPIRVAGEPLHVLIERIRGHIRAHAEHPPESSEGEEGR